VQVSYCCYAHSPFCHCHLLSNWNAMKGSVIGAADLAIGRSYSPD
jgi:hypothetical protein